MTQCLVHAPGECDGTGPACVPQVVLPIESRADVQVNPALTEHRGLFLVIIYLTLLAMTAIVIVGVTGRLIREVGVESPRLQLQVGRGVLGHRLERVVPDRVKLVGDSCPMKGGSVGVGIRDTSINHYHELKASFDAFPARLDEIDGYLFAIGPKVRWWAVGKYDSERDHAALRSRGLSATFSKSVSNFFGAVRSVFVRVHHTHTGDIGKYGEISGYGQRVAGVLNLRNDIHSYTAVLLNRKMADTEFQSKQRSIRGKRNLGGVSGGLRGLFHHSQLLTHILEGQARYHHIASVNEKKQNSEYRHDRARMTRVFDEVPSQPNWTWLVFGIILSFAGACGLFCCIGGYCGNDGKLVAEGGIVALIGWVFGVLCLIHSFSYVPPPSDFQPGATPLSQPSLAHPVPPSEPSGVSSCRA